MNKISCPSCKKTLCLKINKKWFIIKTRRYQKYNLPLYCGLECKNKYYDKLLKKFYNDNKTIELYEHLIRTQTI